MNAAITILEERLKALNRCASEQEYAEITHALIVLRASQREADDERKKWEHFTSRIKTRDMTDSERAASLTADEENPS